MGYWDKDTHDKYVKFIDGLYKFCYEKRIDQALKVDSTYIVEYLLSIYKTGVGYSQLNVARSALSSVVVNLDGIPVGKDRLVCRFLKGVFKIRPSLPKYCYTWDVKIMFDYLRNQPPAHKLKLKELTHSVTILLCILSGGRVQTIHSLDLDFCKISDTSIKFMFPTRLKHTRPTFHQKPLELKSYHDHNLCVVTYIKEYLTRTEESPKSYTKLLLSYIKPHKPVAKDTVARWCSEIMLKAGIDTSVFAPHSLRGASSSSAARNGCTMKQILQAGGWSREETFARFYDKPLDVDFQTAVMKNSI